MDRENRQDGETPHVSILMPCLDAAPFLREAIESVLAQTYASWELLFVDDGSTDGSTDIAREYAGRYPGRVRYFEHPGHANRGMSASRNLGLRHARGAFVAMLDADDVWLPDKLQDQVPLLEARPEAGMLYGNTIFWRSWTDSEPDAGDYVPPLGIAVDTFAPPDLLERCIRRVAAAPCTCSVLMRRSVLEQVGGFEDAFDKLFSDQALYTKMFLAAPVYVAGGTWDRYRLHPTSAVSTARRRGTIRRERRRYLDFVERYARSARPGAAADGRPPLDDELRVAIRTERQINDRAVAAGLFGSPRRGWRRIRARVSLAIPDRLRGRIRRLLRPRGGIRFGNLRRVTPFSRNFGCDRGHAIDRHYVEAFLAAHADDIRGRVLEIGDDRYTRRFGGAAVAAADVLDVTRSNPRATFVDDLASGRSLPSDAFDCVVVTQTLHLVFDVRGAADTLHRILRPGGVLLVTVPGITQIHAGRWKDAWYWSFTPASMQKIFGERFPATDLRVHPYGNVLAACAFLYGATSEELETAELDARDPLYPVIIGVRARKPLTRVDA